MLYIETWKKTLIWAVCALGVLLAMPNMFYERVERFNDAEKLGQTSDEWYGVLPSSLVNLGLDLRGGAHLLAEVTLDEVYAKRMEGMWPELRNALRAERATIGTIRRREAPAGELHVQISNPDGMVKAMEVARSLTSPVVSLTGGAGARNFDITRQDSLLIMSISDAEKRATDDRTMAQTLEIIRRRIDEVGTREPTIQRQGSNRVLIQVPGVDSAQELKTIIGTTAQLTFQAVIDRTTDASAFTDIGTSLVPDIEVDGTFYVLEDAPVVTGEDLTNAQPDFDQNGQPSVSFRFDTAGARAFGRYTSENVGSLFAIVLDNEVISAPVIREPILGGSGQISGNFTVEGATNLAVLLRAGALPASLEFVEERTIGPDLGADSIQAGRLASIVALSLVLVFLVLSYGRFGLYAAIALMFNVAMIFGALSVLGATLTLPGIAGIVLTIGMAVDANVLVFERIREEMRAHNSPARAIDQGYARAMSAILDANVTTFLTAGILFAMGSGPVRGFAVTLGLGILTSVFTAIFVTRVMIVTWFERKKPKTLEV